MAQFQTGVLDSTGVSGGALPSAAQADQAANFRFLVTWTYLSISADSSDIRAEVAERPRTTPISTAPRMMPTPPAVQTELAPVAPPSNMALTSTSRSASDRSAAPFKKSGSGAAFQWEMVVPKMVRTPKKPAPHTKASPNAEQAAGANSPSEQYAPNLYTASSGFLKSFSLKLCLGVVAAAAVAVPVWRHAARPASSTVQTSIEGGDWVRESAIGGDPGVKQSRQLVLYRPALDAKDSRLEFAWTVASGDVGLVFRAKDLGNYYAVRLKVLKPGPTPTLAVEHFNVYQFVESAHTEKVLVFSRNDPVLLVRMDIFGPSFTLYLQDNATEFWTDARLPSGAIGFLEEWDRRAEVHGLRLSMGERSQLPRNRRKTECGAKQFLTCSVVRAAPFALLRNPRKTERSARQFLASLAVRAAPFALQHRPMGDLGLRSPVIGGV